MGCYQLGISHSLSKDRESFPISAIQALKQPPLEFFYNFVQSIKPLYEKPV